MKSVHQIATTLAISASTVRKLIESGQLQAHRIGTKRGQYRVTEQQLTDYLTLTKLETNPCPSENSPPVNGKLTYKTNQEVSKGLGEIFSPKKKPKNTKPPSAPRPTTISLGVENDTYSGKH